MTDRTMGAGRGAFTLTSPAYPDGGGIPSDHTCDGPDLSPPLRWADPPAGTGTFLLTMRDPDARGFLHWVAWDIPATITSLGTGASGALPGGAREGLTDFGGSRRGYRGPCPPSGTHRYVLTLYALAAPIAGGEAMSPDQLERKAADAALGTATLRGHYQRR